MFKISSLKKTLAVYLKYLRKSQIPTNYQTDRQSELERSFADRINLPLLTSGLCPTSLGAHFWGIGWPGRIDNNPKYIFVKIKLLKFFYFKKSLVSISVKELSKLFKKKTTYSVI